MTPVTSLVVVKPNSTPTVGSELVQPVGKSLFFFPHWVLSAFVAQLLEMAQLATHRTLLVFA